MKLEKCLIAVMIIILAGLLSISVMAQDKGTSPAQHGNAPLM